MTEGVERPLPWSLVKLAQVAEILAALPRPLSVVQVGELEWGGTEREYDLLVAAIDANSECGGCDVDMALVVCASHALLDSQISLDHLLNVMRNRKWYAARETSAADKASRDADKGGLERGFGLVLTPA